MCVYYTLQYLCQLGLLTRPRCSPPFIQSMGGHTSAYSYCQQKWASKDKDWMNIAQVSVSTIRKACIGKIQLSHSTSAVFAFLQALYAALFPKSWAFMPHLLFFSQPHNTHQVIYTPLFLPFPTVYLLRHHLLSLPLSLYRSRSKATPARTVLTLSKLRGKIRLKVNKRYWVREEAFIVLTKDVSWKTHMGRVSFR